MFQFDWNEQTDNFVPSKDISVFGKNNIAFVQKTFWAEHCLECSAPKCFKTCEKYKKRADSRCKRTERGQLAIPCDETISKYASRFKFLPWAKIETYIYNDFYDTNQYSLVSKKLFDKTERVLKLKFLNHKKILNNVNYYFLTRSKTRSTEFTKSDFFVFDVYSLEDFSYSMIVEGADENGVVLSRESCLIKKGMNNFVISYDKIAPSKTNVVRFYPENNLCPEVIVFNAEFIKVDKKPAPKVKCVAWDLDNTLWKGILSEVPFVDKLQLRNDVILKIKKLDERGILQTVVSKNDFDIAMDALKHFELADFFLYPAINWGQKSLNIVNIAKELNINVDTFALVDDSIFEREEVKDSLPQVRVFDENVDFLTLPEFDVPITEDAKRRREMYKVEEKRKHDQASFGNDYLDFIKQCRMVVSIDQEILEEGKKKRCYELVNRTNQLNISGHRYSEDDFYSMISLHQKICFSCKDKYGDYGIIGFMSYNIDSNVLIVDELAISCRVAKKHVEFAIFSWLIRKNNNVSSIVVNYVKTPKNTPMLDSLLELGFTFEKKTLFLSSLDLLKDDQIIQIED